MRRVRLLVRLLDRQLYHIYEGRYAHAGSLNAAIEGIVATLEQDPPTGDSAEIDRLNRRCVELNETVTLRFEEKAKDLGQTIRYINLERAIRGVTEGPRAASPPPQGPGPGQKL